MAVVIIKKKKVLDMLVFTCILAMFFGLTSIADASTFLPDLEGHWAQRTIIDMAGKEIVSGYPDGTFKPDGNITRAEFVSLAVRAFALEQNAGKEFNDIANHWAREAIKTAGYYGLVSGYSGGLFGPDDFVTREQIAVIIVNATKITPIETTVTFIDSAGIASWAKEAVEKASAAGMIAGYTDGTFKPKTNATRAEAVVLLAGSMEFVEKETSLTIYDTADTFGPDSGTVTINDNVVINADGVVLQNTIIKGNLTISEKVGNGRVILNNVTVEGTTYILGGGKDSIYINGGQYNEIVIENTPGGNIRLVTTNVEGIQVTISERAAGEEIILEGTFKSVVIKANNVVLSTRGKTTIDELIVREKVAGTIININENTTVKGLILDSVTEVNNAKDTVLKFSGAKLSDSSISNPPEKSPPQGESGSHGSGGETPVQKPSDTYFDDLWENFETTVNIQAQKTSPKEKVTVQFDPSNKCVNVKILDSYHSKGIVQIVYETGIDAAITNLLKSEKIIKIISAGYVVETLDGNGHKKAVNVLRGDAMELAFTWLGNNQISTPLEKYLIGQNIDFTLYGVSGGKELSITYNLYFY